MTTCQMPSTSNHLPSTSTICHLHQLSPPVSLTSICSMRSSCADCLISYLVYVRERIRPAAPVFAGRLIQSGICECVCVSVREGACDLKVLNQKRIRAHRYIDTTTVVLVFGCVICARTLAKTRPVTKRQK